MELPAYVQSVPNRIAFAITGVAMVAVLAWSSLPMAGTWHYATAGGGRPSLRHPVTYQGFSQSEEWGRWSVAGEAWLTFGRALPEDFTAVVRAVAFGPNAGAPVRVCAGDTCSVGTWTSTPSDVPLAFAGVNGARRLRFEIPHPTAPGNGDARKLGIGLVSVTIRENSGR